MWAEFEIWEIVTSYLEGVPELRRVEELEDMGEGGVKKSGKSGDVLYGRPLCLIVLDILENNVMKSNS